MAKQFYRQQQQQQQQQPPPFREEEPQDSNKYGIRVGWLIIPLVLVALYGFKDTPVTIHIILHAMQRAHKRADLLGQVSGTHIFRHTLATVTHQKGATLKEVADILGHKCIDTTTIYTKVNLPMLAKVALPWPEVKL